jgi:hypothetical protein
MINTTLLWMFTIPLFVGIILYAIFHQKRGVWKPIGIYVGVGILITAACFFGGKAGKTADIEIWNGQVVNKERKHDSYQRAYDCMCTTDSKGNRSCQTCYEDRYTVEWNCFTTVGNYEIKKLDRGSRRVYSEPDPERYSSIKIGDPVAKRSYYTNYIQAVPNSLFAPSSQELKQKFASLVPAYPDNVYDFYNLNRFITPGYNFSDADKWNKDIANALREVGPRKQVNTIVVIAKTDDPNYEYAIRDAWEGANKNDVVLLIGSSEYPKIDFVRVISWTKNEAFKVELRDAIEDLQVINTNVLPTLFKQIEKNFERRHMSEFHYLDGEIDPPTWVLIILTIIVIGAGVYVGNLLKKQRF